MTDVLEGPRERKREGGPRAAALAALEACLAAPPELVSYVSEGELLIVGSSARILAIVDRLPGNLRCSSLVTDALAPALAAEQSDRGMACVDRTSRVAITGHLGAFEVTGHRDGAPLGIGAVLRPGRASFDLVLDLQSPPSILLPVPPPGYFAPGSDEDRLGEALAQLGELIGEFDKPKYFMFRRELCAHGASGIEGCRRCLDVCGTGAITSANLSIEIDPYLCQGCGECSTVCPSGAISYAYPGRAETLNRLWRMLDAYFDAGGRSPLVLFHDDAGGKAWVEGNAERLPEFVLPYALESLGSVGLEVWLSALALGAGRVLLLAAARPTGPAQQALVAQIGYAGEILSAMGYEATLVEMIGPDDGLDRLAEDAPALPERPRARFAAVSEKRTVLHMAVEHLHRYGRREAEFAPLSTGAPFGEVWVDGGKCTLCMACVSICPSSALADGGELPRLKFIEANCVQCGLCESACPEDAVALAPRYVYDQQEARRTRVLHEEPVFNCIECGKPFATEKMIKTITDRLQDNWMFQGEGRRRLMMCEDCRVKAMFGRPGGGA